MNIERNLTMKNLKFSVPGQMLLMAKAHLSTAFLFLVLFLLTMSMAGKIRDIIFGICGIIGYFLSIYSAAGTAHNDDKKTISPLTPKPAKGLILPLILTVFSVICILLYKLAWTHGITESGSLELWAVPLNVIALFWVAPYQPLLGMVQGSLSLCGYLIVFLTPIVASGLGYFASFHNFDLNAKIHSLAYEKKKDKEEF